MIKIGDKVRFLDAIGGGRVVGFRDKNTVLVEDEDGFEVPALISSVVVVEASVGEQAKALERQERKDMGAVTTKSLHQALNEIDDEDDDRNDVVLSFSESDAPYFTEDLDTIEGERLDVCLAVTPDCVEDLSKSKFNVALINDDNYHVAYVLSTKVDNELKETGVPDEWKLQEVGQIEPHTKLELTTLDNKRVGEWERISVQLIAYKSSRSYVMKSTYSANLHLSPVRLYKRNSYKQNDYVDNDSLIVPIVKDDVLSSPMQVEAKAIKESMLKKGVDEKPRASRIEMVSKGGQNEPLEIDLHIDKLLDSNEGMSPKEILDYQIAKFREVMNANRKNKGKRIVFIHGKGEGVLRSEIMKRLTLEYPTCDRQDASFLRYGYGATMVTVR